MVSVADAFKDDLEEIRKVRNTLPLVCYGNAEFLFFRSLI